MVADKRLYGTKLVKIPTPRFVVFYNGTKEQPKQQVLRLSDSFEQPLDETEIELLVTMPTRDAVNHTVNECIQEGLLTEFLTQYKAEAIEVSIFEYDETAHMSYVHEEGREEGQWTSKISLIQKKLDKKLDAVQITDMIEEDEKTVAELISLIAKNPDKSKDDLAALYLK